MLGAYNMGRKRFYWKAAQRGNGKSFVAFLHQLRLLFPGRKLCIVLDNVSYHKSGIVKRFLVRHSEIVLIYLPPYSPEYNPVERIWKWFKKKVSEFGSVRKGIKEIIARFRIINWYWFNNRLVDALNVGIGVWHEIFTNIYAE